MRGRDSTFSMLKQIASLPISDKASCNYGNYIQCELHALQNLKEIDTPGEGQNTFKFKRTFNG